MLLYRILLILSCLLLTNCGFQPIYKNHNDGKGSLIDLSSVKINNVDNDRYSRKFAYLLQEQLNIYNKKVESLYTLEFTLKKSYSLGSILKDSQATRKKIIITVNYFLKDMNNVVIDKGLINNFSSFDISPSNEFANYTSESYLIENIISELSKELKLRLASILIKQNHRNSNISYINPHK